MSDRVESVVVDDVSPCQVIFEGGQARTPTKIRMKAPSQEWEILWYANL